MSSLSVRDVRGVGLGTAPFAFRDGTAEQSIATIEAALDAGVQLIDTALAYTRPGVESYAEELVGRVIRSRSLDDVVVATKGGHWRSAEGFPIDGRAETLRAHIRISLRTLGVERIDLYQLHHTDPATPLGESVGALRELQQLGDIAEIGLSNVSIEQLVEARSIAEISSVQNRLSFSTFGDFPVAEFCRREGVRYLAYMPLDGAGGGDPRFALPRAIAARHGVSVQRLLLAWMQQLPLDLIPLVGASRPATIVDSVASTELLLDETELAELTAAARA